VGCTTGPRWASSSQLREASHISAGQRIEAAFKAETIGREPVGGWLVARKTLGPRFHADDSDRPARRTHESDQMCLCSATARAD
jgi:hypothetical protein